MTGLFEIFVPFVLDSKTPSQIICTCPTFKLCFSQSFKSACTQTRNRNESKEHTETVFSHLKKHGNSHVACMLLF